MQNIHKILEQHWGYSTFRPLQEEIILSVLNGTDTLALLPTGGGKSICFQLPGLAMEGMCLVVSPLIALMKDQVYHLHQKGIKASAIYTGMSYRVIDSILDNCVLGKVKFLYISPERLASEDFRVRMMKMNVSLLAVDEAHCISQWGYDFRPPYLKIAEVRELLKNVPVIALTATATPEVVDDIQTRLLFKKRNVLQKSFLRKNLSYVVRRTVNKEQELLDILKKVNGSAVVYVRNRKKTKDYSDFLNKHGVKSDFYHAGLEPNERTRKQDIWIKNKTRVICCTNAFGMGIDKPDVRIVIHMDVTESLEAYFQEAGRAGRDEQKAYAVQLLDNSDILEIDKKINKGFPETDFIKDVYDTLCVFLRIAYNTGANQTFDFALENFTTQHHLNSAKTLSALKIMQQQEIIYLSESVYSLSKIKCVCTKDALFSFQEKHKALEPLVKFILRTSEGIFEDYVDIDEQAIAPRLKIRTEEVTKQLMALDVYRIFSYKPRKNKPQVIFLQNRVKREAIRLDQTFIEKRKQDYEQRLKAVRYYISENTLCRTRVLVKYFGEILSQDCGICDVCLAKKKSGLSNEAFAKIVTEIENELKQNSLSFDELKYKLNIKKEHLNQLLDYLKDCNRIYIKPEGKVEWQN